MSAVADLTLGRTETEGEREAYFRQIPPPPLSMSCGSAANYQSSPDLYAFHPLTLVKERENVNRFVCVTRRIDLDRLHFDPVNSQLAQASVYLFDGFLSQADFEGQVRQRVADAELL